ncbi:hypothetical protein IF1G_01280 [Cordyceps javanica]|uniref:Ribonucleases P/MRP subunit Pop8-like domain-containing protein n=1 Tax=Cordyceps javanica TaxID=43265 RepID=A0A545VBG2_9HYPO|nr:hypothetical protein IF1G_01280 [Cordyceps javanica]TQW11257.1 hypothetical protein IF2G_02199 [Cordyceps javanica]
MASQTTRREFTIKAPEFAYAHLELHTDGSSAPEAVALDELLVRSYCADALRQYLGQTGAGIPLDVLKVAGRQCWVRMPRDDVQSFAAALTAYRGSVAGGGGSGDGGSTLFLLRVKQCSDWLGTMVGSEALEKLWRG